MGRAIVNNGDFTAYVCYRVPQPSELRFGVVCAVGRGIAVLDGVHVVQREGDVLGVFVPHSHNEKCHWVADGEMFPIRMRKLDNVSVWQTYRWKARFVGFWRHIHCSFKINVGVYDPHAVWHHRSDWSRDEAGSGVWGSFHMGVVLLGANLGRAIVTNGDFTVV